MEIRHVKQYDGLIAKLPHHKHCSVIQRDDLLSKLPQLERSDVYILNVYTEALCCVTL